MSISLIRSTKGDDKVVAQKGATAGRINCCGYFKISGRVYAVVRGKRRETRPTVIPFILSSLSRFFLFPLFISFRHRPRPPHTYKPERAHKLSLLRIQRSLKHRFTNGYMGKMSVNEFNGVAVLSENWKIKVHEGTHFNEKILRVFIPFCYSSINYF